MTQSATDRIELRLVPGDKDLLAMAAAREGLTLAAFIRNAAVRAAKAVVAQDQVIRFTTSEAKAYIEALDQPFVPNAELTKALEIVDSIEKKGLMPATTCAATLSPRLHCTNRPPKENGADSQDPTPSSPSKASARRYST